ncbi:hypothetical protein [Geobacter sp. SVR]
MPEPATCLLLVSGLAGLGAWVERSGWDIGLPEW